MRWIEEEEGYFVGLGVLEAEASSQGWQRFSSM